MSRRVPKVNLDLVGVNPRVPFGLFSDFGPVRYEWLYRIAPRILETHKPYHYVNMGTQLAGNFHLLWIFGIKSF